MSDFPTQALLETSERVATRWKNALAEIQKANYGPNQWLRDALGFWLDDVADVWLGSGTGTTVLLLTTNDKQSDEIFVPNVNTPKAPKLSQLGGTKTIQTTLDRTPQTGSTPKGTVVVKIPIPSGAVSGEQ